MTTASKETLLQSIKKYAKHFILSKQPGNLKSNRELYNGYTKKYPDSDISLRTFMALLLLYTKNKNIDEAFCQQCNKLCNTKSDLSFHMTCSRECGRILSAQNNSKQYANKTEEEKQAIKNKRAQTNLKNGGSTTNLQFKEVQEKRIAKHGANTPFADPEVRATRQNTLKEKYNVDNPYQIPEAKMKSKRTKLERYGDPNYRNREKIKKTCLERYGKESYLGTTQCRESLRSWSQLNHGVDHPMQSPEILERYQKSIILKYGVHYTMQSPEVRKKSIATCMRKYGVPYNCLRPEFTYRLGRISGVNKTWYALLSTILPVTIEYPLDKLRYDFKLDDITLLEVNPTPTHNVKEFFLGRKVKNRKPNPPEYHLNKTYIALTNNFFCIHVWDWDNKDKILNFIQPNTTTISKVDIKPIDRPTAYTFLNTFHLNSIPNRHTMALGAFHDDKLLAVSTYTEYTRNEYKWTRFAKIGSIDTKQGILKDMHDYFICTYDPYKVITLLDLSKYKPTHLEHLGFATVHVTQMNLHYSKRNSDKVLHRYPTYTYNKHKNIVYTSEYYTSEDIDFQNDLGHLHLPRYFPVFDVGSILLSWTKNS